MKFSEIPEKCFNITFLSSENLWTIIRFLVKSNIRLLPSETGSPVEIASVDFTTVPKVLCFNIGGEAPYVFVGMTQKAPIYIASSIEFDSIQPEPDNNVVLPVELNRTCPVCGRECKAYLSMPLVPPLITVQCTKCKRRYPLENIGISFNKNGQVEKSVCDNISDTWNNMSLVWLTEQVNKAIDIIESTPDGAPVPADIALHYTLMKAAERETDGLSAEIFSLFNDSEDRDSFTMLFEALTGTSFEEYAETCANLERRNDNEKCERN